MIDSSNMRSLILRWKILQHFRELVIISGTYFLYMFIRKFLIPNIELTAVENAFKVVDFELSAGFLWELNWQSWAVGSAKAVVIFLNWTYIVTFWPIIAVTGVTLYVCDRSKYTYYRNVLLLSFVLALILYSAFPLAPPRYLVEYGFVDTIQKFGPTWYGSRDMQVFYNAFAAMPSLHFAWTILFGVLFLRSKYIWIKPLGIIYPSMTFFAITITGNHYIVDALGGALVIIASFAVYWLICAANANRPDLLAQTKLRLGRTVAILRSSGRRWMLGLCAILTGLSTNVSACYESLQNRKLTIASNPVTDRVKGLHRRR